MRRSDRKLNQTEALKIIDECVWATISCVDEGEVFSLPLSIVRDGNFIYIHGAPKGKKSELFTNERICTIVAVNFAKVPDLSEEFLAGIAQSESKLGNFAFTTEYKSAIAKTRANLVTDEAEKLHALRILSQKYCAKYMKHFEMATKTSLKHTNIYKFEITELSAKAKLLNL